MAAAAAEVAQRVSVIVLLYFNFVQHVKLISLIIYNSWAHIMAYSVKKWWVGDLNILDA